MQNSTMPMPQCRTPPRKLSTVNPKERQHPPCHATPKMSKKQVQNKMHPKNQEKPKAKSTPQVTKNQKLPAPHVSRSLDALPVIAVFHPYAPPAHVSPHGPQSLPRRRTCYAHYIHWSSGQLLVMLINDTIIHKHLTASLFINQATHLCPLLIDTQNP